MQNNKMGIYLLQMIKEVYEAGRDDGYDLHIHDVSGTYPDGLDRDAFMQKQEDDTFTELDSREQTWFDFASKQ